ncbi:transposase, partial [Microcoleus sp. C2C3]|uniref:transposase n=1 Tax=Microcoleus sp. C2C3 TaxID=3055324 RepID=UPI002FD0FCBF
RTGKMPIPQEKITLVGWASCPSHQLSKRIFARGLLSTKIVSENQVIVLEDLNVSFMIQNRKLSRAISLQGWYQFRAFCEAKSEKFGREFKVIDRWEPTSQICSDCGYRWGKLDLGVRQVVCLNCGANHDRDGNAAKNIEKVGMGYRHDSKRTQRKSKTTEGSIIR